MKNNFTLFLLLLTSAFAGAQPVIEIKQGPKLKAPLGVVISKLIGQDETGFYIRRGDKPWDCYIDKFDKKTLKSKKSTQVRLLQPLEFFYENNNEINLELVNGEIIFVYDLFDKEGLKKVVYFQKMDRSGGLSAFRNELFTMPCKSGLATAKSNFSCRFTPDKTKFIIKLSGDKDVMREQTLTLYDTEKQKRIFTKLLPETYMGQNVSRIFLDRVENNGDVSIHFFTGSIRAKSQKVYYSEIKERSYIYEQINDDGAFKDDSKSLFSGSELKSKDKLISAGLYTEKINKPYNKKHPPEFKVGIYIGIKDMTTGKLTTENYTLLAEDVYKKLTYKLKDAEESRTTPGEKQLVSKRILKMNDFYYLIVEHQYEIRADRSGNDLEEYNKKIEINRELIITQFDLTGAYKWMKIIPKYTSNAGEYDVMRKEGKLYFFYNENPKNATFDIVNYPDANDCQITASSGSNIVCTVIDEAGTVTKQVVGQNKPRQLYYTPKNLNVFQDDEKTTLVVLFSNGKKARFGTIQVH